MTAEIPPNPDRPAIDTAPPLDMLPMFNGLLEQQGGDIAVIDDGSKKVAIVGHPAYIRMVFEGDAFREKGSAYTEIVSPIIGDGIVTSSGEKWRTRREFLGRTLRPQMVRKRVDEIAEVGHNFVNDLVARTENGTPVDLQTEMTRLTFQTITRFLCGRGLAPLAEQHISLTDLQAVFDSIQQLRGPVTPEQEAHINATLAKLDAATLTLVRAARGQEKNETVLSQLAYAGVESPDKWDDQAIRDEFITLLFAGHETMELSLSWFFCILDQHPEILARIRQELQALSSDDPSAATTRRAPDLYMHKVVNELWRLFPPTPFISRKVSQETRLGHVDLAPNDDVVLSIWHAQRHPGVWSSPDRPPADAFHPDRFSELTDQESKAYFPFAYGERNCLGQFLAQTEIAVLAPILLRDIDMQFSRPTSEVSAVANLTLHPHPRLQTYIARRALHKL